MLCACAILYLYLWPVRLHHIFPYYVINGTIFEEKFLNTKCVFGISVHFLSEIFLIPRGVERDIIINAHRSVARLAQTSPDQATLEGSSCTSIMTCTGGCGYSF